MIRQALGGVWYPQHLTEHPAEVGAVITSLQMEASTICGGGVGRLCKGHFWTFTGPHTGRTLGRLMPWATQSPVVSGSTQVSMTPRLVPIWE